MDIKEYILIYNLLKENINNASIICHTSKPIIIIKF